VPTRNELRRKYSGKPVVFIAVNSGNSRAAVEEYAKSAKLDWPILVDEWRETETRYGRKISLSNVYWYFVVAPDGTYREFGADQGGAENHIQALLAGARMLFGGIEVPPELRPIGRRLEDGQLGDPVHELFQFVQKDGSELQEAANKMYSRVQPMGETRLRRAKELEAAGNKVGAFDGFTWVAKNFPGIPMAQEAQKKAEGLQREKEVRTELHARGLLDQARSALGRGKAGRAQARAILEGVTQGSPRTPAAEAARLMIRSLEASEKK